MKKYILPLALALCAMLVVSGCTKAPAPNNTDNSPAATPSPSPTNSPATNPAPGAGNENAVPTNIKIGQALYPAHGTKSWAVATVALSGDTIVAAWLDEYQFLSSDTGIGVPSYDVDEGLGQYMPEGYVLGSKRVNWESYSANMSGAAGATKTLLEGYEGIEDFVKGKTVSEVTQTANLESGAVIDAVSGVTLVDTKGYLEAIVEAAKLAK